MSKVMLSHSAMSIYKDEIYDWLEDNIGERYVFNAHTTFSESKDRKWYVVFYSNYKNGVYNHIEHDSYFYFKDNNDAILFKLTWGGK